MWLGSYLRQFFTVILLSRLVVLAEIFFKMSFLPFSLAKSMKLTHHPSGPEKISSLNSTRKSTIVPPSCLHWNSSSYNNTIQMIYSCHRGSVMIGSAQMRHYCPLVLGPLLLIPGPLVTSVPRHHRMNK